MQKFKILLLVLIAFIFGLFSPQLITYVLAHGGNTNFLHSCVKTSGIGGIGSIRMILPSGNCNSNETAVDWTKLPWNSDFPLMCQHCDLSHDIVGDLFVGKDLSNALLQDSVFYQNDLRTTVLTNAHLPGVQFAEVNLQGQNMSNLDLRGTNFQSSNITNVNFSGANFSTSGNYGCANLAGTDISGVNFTNANLACVVLQVVLNASSANFTGANMSGVSLSGSNLSNVNFSGVDLSGASISGSSTNLSNANFSGANLTGAILNEATGFDTANRTGVIYGNTTCPDNTNSDNNGNTCEGHLTP